MPNLRRTFENSFAYAADAGNNHYVIGFKGRDVHVGRDMCVQHGKDPAPLYEIMINLLNMINDRQEAVETLPPAKPAGLPTLSDVMSKQTPRGEMPVFDLAAAQDDDEEFVVQAGIVLKPRPPAGTVAIDLSNVGYMEREGYEAIRFFFRARNASRVVLVGVPENISSIFEMTGMTKQFGAENFVKTLDEAWGIPENESMAGRTANVSRRRNDHGLGS